MDKIRNFFERAYTNSSRYWWRKDNAYSTRPEDHADSLITQAVLRFAWSHGPGGVLDLGSGEGADAIRLARMGWRAVAVELTTAGTRKIKRFAHEAGVSVDVVQADARTFATAERFDLIICNGLLHYIDRKTDLCHAIQQMTNPGGVNALSLWSTYTPVPECHQVVPTFPDDERGEVVSAYSTWRKSLLYFERARHETSHADMAAHVHSHIKMVASNDSSTYDKLAGSTGGQGMRDVVNEQDEVVGRADKATIESRKLISRVSFVMLSNSRGELLLHQRSANKKAYPLYWSGAAAGHLVAGESYHDAASRELREELGVETDLEFIGKFYSKDDREMVAVFLGFHDGPVAFEPWEVERVEYFSPGRLVESRPSMKITSFVERALPMVLARMQGNS